MKVLVVNQYNSDNIGDKLLNEMTCQNLKNLGHECVNAGYAQTISQEVDFTENQNKKGIISSIKRNISPFFKYILLYNKRLKEIQKNISECDAIIIGGGQLIKHNNVFLYCMLNWIKYAKKKNLPVLIHGVGIDSNLNKYEINLYAKAIKYATAINVRDKQSADFLKKYFNVDADVSPDIAFTYLKTIREKKDNAIRSGILVMPYNYTTAKYVFDYDINQNEYYDMIIKFIKKEIEDNKKQLIELTATTSADVKECYKLQEYLKEKGYSVDIQKAKTVTELAELMLNCKTIITGRMHAMILGMLCGCKIKPICVSDKIKDFSTNYLEHEIDLSEVSNEATDGIITSLKKLK